MPLMWYIPFEGEPEFVRDVIYPEQFTERLDLSPTIVMLYNTDQKTPNKFLTQFGYAVKDIRGDAIFVAEELTSNTMTDISISIEQELPDILEQNALY